MRLFNDGLTISDDDVRVLLNDLYDPDSNSAEGAIERWIVNGLQGKIANCRARMLDHWTTELRVTGELSDFPTEVDPFLEMVAARPEYMDRAAREIESQRTISDHS